MSNRKIEGVKMENSLSFYEEMCALTLKRWDERDIVDTDIKGLDSIFNDIKLRVEERANSGFGRCILSFRDKDVMLFVKTNSDYIKERLLAKLGDSFTIEICSIYSKEKEFIREEISITWEHEMYECF